MFLQDGYMDKTQHGNKMQEMARKGKKGQEMEINGKK